jgi:NAD(P)H dehydrogenase (quinone)
MVVASTHHDGKVYELTGPRLYSFDEVAALASGCSGLPIRYVNCSPSDYLRTAWEELQDPWPHAFSTLCESIAQGRYGHVSRDVEGLLDRPAEGLDDFFRRTITHQSHRQGTGR